MFDPAKLKADFPILSKQTASKSLVYLDNAATSQKPRQVLDAVQDFYENHNANPHRGVYSLAEEATALYEGARSKVAGFIGAPKEQLVFCRSATEALNLFVWGWASHNIEEGDAIVVTEMEHHANIVPWHILREEYQLELRWVGISDTGILDMDDFRDKVQGAKVVAVTLASNVLGTVNPVGEISSLAHEAGAKVLVDAAQAAPHMEIDVTTLGCDALAITGHKMLGPMGIGALWAKSDIINAMDPVYGGGEMIREVRTDGYEPAEAPEKFEAGTMPAADAVGWAAAVSYLERLGMPAIREHETHLTEYALETLSSINGVKVYGPADAKQRVGLVSFTVKGIHAHDLATILDDEGLAIRSGHHCAQPLHKRLNVPATARASFSVYNTKDDIDRLAAGIRTAQKVFQSA